MPCRRGTAVQTAVAAAFALVSLMGNSAGEALQGMGKSFAACATHSWTLERTLADASKPMLALWQVHSRWPPTGGS